MPRKDVRFLDVECVGRASILAVIRLDIDGKTDVGTDIMVSSLVLNSITHLFTGDVMVREIFQKPKDLPAGIAAR